MSILDEISDKFWSPSIWLPKNFTWADVAPGSRPNINYADYKELLWSIPMAIALFVVRYYCENCIFSTFGQWLGVKSERSNKRLTPNQTLEAAYNKKCKRLDDDTIIGLTKQLESMSRREIERWWRLRRARDKPTVIRKFCESSWRCLYYTCSFLFGLFVLWDKPWLWDVGHCWLDYPHHSVDIGLRSYYLVSLSLYLSLLVSQFFDVKRKDFWMMFVHHFVSASALSISWISHFHRIGSLVLLYHDFADVFLEATKTAKYAKCQKLCDILTALFVFAWTISRMILYPRLVYCCVIKSIHSRRVTVVSRVLLCLLVLLQCMNIVWTYMIYSMAYTALKHGKVKKDYRSSSGSDGSDMELSDSAKCENDEKIHKQNKSNHTL